jgi:hypothetical protein
VSQFRRHKLGTGRILKSINVNMVQNCSCCIAVSPLCDHGLSGEVNTTKYITQTKSMINDKAYDDNTIHDL